MIIINYFLLGLKFIGKLPLYIIRYLPNIIKWFIKGLIMVITIFPKYFILGLTYIFNKNKRDAITNKKGKPIIPIIMMSLSIIVYLISIFLFSRWSVQKLKTNYLINDIEKWTAIIEIEEEKIVEVPTEVEPEIEEEEETVYYPNDYWDYISVPFVNVNFYELKNINSSTVGWLKVNNTNVNYPVVQANNNDYYLTHDFKKSNNRNGWIYADYRSDFTNYGKNNIIYGHNLYNRTMFGSLVWTLKSYWYTNTDNQYIKMSSPTVNTVWRIFSLYMGSSETYYLRTKFTDDADYQEFLTTLKSRSVYDFGITPTTDDKILTLSTCDDTGTKRIAIHAKMVNIEYR